MSASKKKKSKNKKKNSKKVKNLNNSKNVKKQLPKNDFENNVDSKDKENSNKNKSNKNNTKKEEKSASNKENKNIIKDDNKEDKKPADDKKTQKDKNNKDNKDNKDNKANKSNKTNNKTNKKNQNKKGSSKVSNSEKTEKVEENIKENIEEKREEKNADEKENTQVGNIFKNKKIIYVFICIFLIILLFIIFSTCFAILNINNKNIVKGVSIKDIDLSDTSKEEAISKINDAINLELMSEINIKYGDDYQVTLKPEQIEFKYKIDDALQKAINFGKTGNIIINNYSLIYSTFFGKNIDLEYTYNEELLNKFIDDVSSKIPGVVVNPTYYIEGDKLIVSKGTDGIQVKKDDLKNQILDEINSRKLEDVTQERYSQTIEIPIEQLKAEKIDMSKIYSEIHTEPKNAYYETNPYNIYPDIDGVDLVMSVEEAQNIVNTEPNEEYSFDLKITKAEITIDDLGTEAFPYLISSFSTNYVASNINRSINLKIAAEKINGKVLMPGEEFSFNQVVGKRTVEEGYKDAAIYADGGVVDGLAGGICQISSTLYNAVLLANLQITERRNHTYTTSYLEAGKDATVVWGTIDFKFVNSRAYPIKIEASVAGGIATFKIHGIQEETEYEVKILPVKTQSIPYTTSYIEDPTLAPGQQVISQAGHAGYKVTTYKELLLNGTQISREAISNDTYSPMRAIIRIGPGTPTQNPIPIP